MWVSQPPIMSIMGVEGMKEKAVQIKRRNRFGVENGVGNVSLNPCSRYQTVGREVA